MIDCAALLCALRQMGKSPMRPCRPNSILCSASIATEMAMAMNGASSSSRLITTEDRNALRQSGERGKQRQQRREEVMPGHLAIFVALFPGERSFYTELALFKEAPPRLTGSRMRSLRYLIHAQALLRVSRLRRPRDCAHCRTLTPPPPFCLVAHVQPVGAKQHGNAHTQSCIWKRAFNGGGITARRILALLTDSKGRLRLDRDTDDQGGCMEMLPNYARALWNAAHRLGLNQILRVIQSVFRKHGIPQPCSPSQSQQTEELEERLKELQDSIGHDDADVVEELAALHVAIWAADYADYAMQAIIAVLEAKLGQSQTRMECPDGWLEAEANALHAHYAPEEYETLEGEVQRVERQHTRMHTMLQAWITECTPASAAAHNPTIRRHDQDDDPDDDDSPAPTAERQDDAVVQGQDEGGVEYEPQEAFALIPDDPVLPPAQATRARCNRLGLSMLASAGAAVAVGMTLYMLRPPSADAVAEPMPSLDARQQARMRGYAYVNSRLHPL